MRKFGLIVLVILLLLGGVSFILLRMVNNGTLQPIKVEFSRIDIEAGKDSIGFVFHTNIANPRTYIFHPKRLTYKVYMDSLVIAHGERNIFNCDTCAKQVNDTFQLPLTLRLDRIRSKVGENIDSTDLVVKMELYFDLFGSGLNRVPISIERRIPAPNPPEIKVLDVELDILRIDTMALNLKGKIINPNNFELVVTDAHFNIDFQKLFDADLVLTDTFRLKAKGESEFGVMATANNLQLVRDAFKILFQTSDQPYILSGSAKMQLGEEQRPIGITVLNEGAARLKPWKRRGKK